MEESRQGPGLVVGGVRWPRKRWRRRRRGAPPPRGRAAGRSCHPSRGEQVGAGGVDEELGDGLGESLVVRRVGWGGERGEGQHGALLHVEDGVGGGGVAVDPCSSSDVPEEGCSSEGTSRQVRWRASSQAIPGLFEGLSAWLRSDEGGERRRRRRRRGDRATRRPWRWPAPGRSRAGGPGAPRGDWPRRRHVPAVAEGEGIMLVPSRLLDRRGGAEGAHSVADGGVVEVGRRGREGARAGGVGVARGAVAGGAVFVEYGQSANGIGGCMRGVLQAIGAHDRRREGGDDVALGGLSPTARAAATEELTGGGLEGRESASARRRSCSSYSGSLAWTWRST